MWHLMRGSGRTVVLVITLATAGCSLPRAHDSNGLGVMAALPASMTARGGVLAAATWSRKVRAGVSPAEIEEAFLSVATEDNLRPAGEMTISRELELRDGKAVKFLKIYSYCDPVAARMMVEFRPALAAFMPCRIAVVEQTDGLWIYTMNMDLLISDVHSFPPELESTIRRFRASVVKLLDRGAAGEF
jgi:hypothetical protein